MRTYPLFGKALPALVGMLLIGVAVAHTAVSSFVVPDLGTTTFWSMLADMLPIPGGVAVHVPEIDPGSATNAVALVLGGTLLVVGLRRKPNK